MIRHLLFVLAALIATAAPAAAASCSFTISTMNFGDVDTLAGDVVDVTATLNVNCTGVLLGAVRVCPNIAAGTGGASGASRLMTDGAKTLPYRIFQDPARSIPWGSVEQTAVGNPPTFDFFTSIGGSVSATRTLYGRIPAGQQLAATGTYSSSFTAAHVKIAYSELTLFNCLTLQAPVAAPFTVQAKVQPNCLITAQNIHFGAHGVLRSNVDANGALSVTCTPGTAYAVSLDGGGANSGPTARRMTHASGAVTYGLYRDAARTLPWSAAAGQMASGNGTGSAQSITVFGRVPPQPSPAPGIYSDTVVATVTY